MIPGTPSSEDWRQLWRLTSHVELIVEDAPSGGSVRIQPIGGLLDFGNSKPTHTAVEEQDTAVSRLKGELSWFGGRVQDVNAVLRDELEALCPGISDLGDNRQERLEALQLKLASHKAYAWLSSSAHYSSACRALKILASRGVEGYQRDTALLRLHSVTSFWMMLWKGRRKRDYPTRSDLKRAHLNAKALLRFVKDSQGLYLRGRLSYFDPSHLAKLTAELATLERSYKRPKTSDPTAEAEHAYVLIRLLNDQFGKASPSIVEHVLGLIGYDVDKDRVKELISLTRKE